jgi:hypothetical protein
MQNKENKKPVQEIKFGMTKEEFAEIAKKIQGAPESHVKISFGIDEKCELSLSFYSVGDSSVDGISSEDGREEFIASRKPCPPAENCPPKPKG